MWRIYIDEAHFTDAELIAWNKILPYTHLPILDQDRENVRKEVEYLEKAFSKQALQSAVKRLNLKRNVIQRG